MKTIKIIFEDDYILVIDKPAGIIVNKSDTTKGEQTVQDWVESRIKNQESKIKYDKESDFYKRAGIVHRLDKETSGILIIAKTSEAFSEMQRQFKERIVKKTYIALAHGKIIPEEGKIIAPVGRLPWNRKRFGILAGGREAVTRYKVLLNIKHQSLNKKEDLTLLKLYPETGRTHQIRVHLKYLNHPIFADFLYAGRKTSREDRKLLERVFLHAARISFLHPVSGKEVAFESPVSDDLNNALDRLRN